MNRETNVNRGEYLSAAIIETLKELSNTSGPITPALLHDALLKREEFNALFHQIPHARNGLGASAEAAPGDMHHPEPCSHDMEAARNAVDLPCGIHLRKLHDACLGILSNLGIDPGQEHVSHLVELRGLITTTQDLNRLISLSDDTISLLHVYAEEVNVELSRFTHLMAEIGQNLVEMEKHLFSSFAHAQDVYKTNTSFSLTLDRHVQEIVGSFQISKTLADLRGFVASRMDAIRLGIEAKRKEDERQFQKITKEMKQLKQRLVGMKEEMYLARERTKTLEQEVLLDPLTGIHNRRAYEQRLQEELRRYYRYQQTFALLLIDLDHFKSINDRYGHWAGDRCLVEITRLFASTLRESDFLARYGGEEFIILLLGVEKEGLRVAAERIRQLVEKAHFLYQGQAMPVTVSIGATCAQPTDENMETLFNRVDTALYEAKDSGRNCVVIR